MYQQKVGRNFILKKLLTLLAVLILFTITASSASAQTYVQVKNVQGEAVDYENLGETPLLHNFKFRYLEKDHHITRIRVMPNGNEVRFNYEDKEPNDPYDAHAGYLIGQDVLERPLASQSNCRGSCEIILAEKPKGMVFVLQGFDLKFTNSDHHIHRISIEENSGKLTVYFGDKGLDDPFNVQVKYVYLPESMVKSESQSSLNEGIKVIAGFEASFEKPFGEKADNHLKTFGVENGDGDGRVLFEDSSGDDRLYTNVKWVYLDIFPYLYKAGGFNHHQTIWRQSYDDDKKRWGAWTSQGKYKPEGNVIYFPRPSTNDTDLYRFAIWNTSTNTWNWQRFAVSLAADSEEPEILRWYWDGGKWVPADGAVNALLYESTKYNGVLESEPSSPPQRQDARIWLPLITR